MLCGNGITVSAVGFLLQISGIFVEILTQINSTRKKSVTVLLTRPPDLASFFVEFRLSYGIHKISV